MGFLPKFDEGLEKDNSPVNIIDDAYIPDAFPMDTYQANLDLYTDYEQWFDSTKLDETFTSNDTEVELYPVKINPLSGAALKHSYALFGEFEDDSRPLVIPKLISDEAKKDEELIKPAEAALNHIWWENGGRALMMKNGLLSQVFGGCVFKVTYVPWQTWRQIPFYIEAVHPAQFVGVASGGDYWHLTENWFVKHISHADALRFGVKTDQDDPLPIMIEHYTNDHYKVTVNGSVAKLPKQPDKFMEGENIYGVTPATYIPHIRFDGLYGISLLKDLIGLTKEMNLRMGDYGDAVNDDAHSSIAMRNVTGTPKVVRIGDGLPVINLTGRPNISGKESEPDLFAVEQSKASSSMSDLVEKLWTQFKRASMVPGVAYGEDSGSQRSALTLVTRMWPLVSHIRQERVLWSAGLDVFNSTLLKMMEKKGKADVKKEHLKFRMRQDWYPILPRDRQELVNEVVQRAAVNLGSIEHLMEMLGDVELPAEEMERIKSWVTFLASVENKNDETNNNSSAEDPENTSESSKAKKGRSGNRAVQSGKTQEDK